jgi:hypothetical protein
MGHSNSLGNPDPVPRLASLFGRRGGHIPRSVVLLLSVGGKRTATAAMCKRRSVRLEVGFCGNRASVPSQSQSIKPPADSYRDLTDLRSQRQNTWLCSYGGNKSTGTTLGSFAPFSAKFAPLIRKPGPQPPTLTR